MLLQRVVTSWSIRRKLLVLILTVLLPAGGIIVLDGIKDRSLELEDAKHHAILMVESLSTQQGQIAAETRLMLRTLAQSPQLQSLDTEACNKLFRELRDQNQVYSAISASTPDGDMFASTTPFEPGSVNISERKYIKDTMKSVDFSAGEYMLGRATNIPAIYYGYPVRDAGKRIIAIVGAGFRLSEYDSFIKKANLPSDSAVVILDHQGLRLYRYPEDDAAPLGRPLATGFEQIAGLDDGTFERKSDDGVYRLFAFKRLRLTESSSPYLLIAAGVPKDKILEKANFAMSNGLLILGLAATTAASLAWLIGNLAFTRPINRLVNAAKRFGSGEMAARTGLPHTYDELGKLAQSFDSMAEWLEQRDLERKNAEEELDSAFRKNQLILNAADEGIVGLDERGAITFANPAAGEMLGYEEKELIGRDLHPMIHHSFPDGTHYPVTECPMWLCLRNGTSLRVRDEVLWKKDGTSFPAAYSSTPIMENGQVVGAVVTFRDISVRKRVEEALLRSQRQLTDIIEFLPDATFVINNEGIVIAWNRAMEAMSGISKSKMIGKGDFEYSLPFYGIRRPLLIDLLFATEAKKMKYYDSVSTMGDAIVAEAYVPRAYGGKGSYMWGVASALFDGQGKVTGAIESVRDITERKLVEIALRESEQRFSRFFAAAPVSTSITRLSDGQFTDINDAFLGLFGFTREEVVGQNPLELGMWANPEDRAKMVEILQEQGRIHDFETRFIRKSGEIGHVSVSAVVIEMAGQEYILGLTHDITERKLAEAAIRKSEERYRLLFNSANDAFFVHLGPTGGFPGRFIEVNDVGCKRLGYSREELLQMSPLDIDAPDTIANIPQIMEHLTTQGHATWEGAHMTKQGQRIPIEITNHIFELDGKPTVLATVRDLTERKKAKAEKEKLEEQLFQAQKMESVGRLAGGVAHDFNNMLGVIIGRTELALKMDVATGELRDNLQETLEAGLRSANIARQLLAFARKQTAVPRILDLNGTVSAMLKVLQRLIGEDIGLSWQPEPDLWTVKIDPSQVDQILANLLVNARDAISGVGAITMVTENVVIGDSNRAETPELIAGEYVLLTVNDTGAGMSKEVRKNIFEPFFTTKEAGKGTGLGLSTVYGIVKQNDGFIYAASEPGKGTTFKIYLPRFEAETAQVHSEEAAGKPTTGTEIILLVEDDEAILKLGKMILEKLGYTVLAVQSPVDAIHLVEEHPGDLHLLITDVVMPGMNGRELAERLKAIRPNLKCLYISGYTADVIAKQGILDEGLNFIQKPFLSDEFAGRVRQVLGHLE
ncbi:MAG: PAS domain S-box protein [Syntrophobacteraceae bacterium]